MLSCAITFIELQEKFPTEQSLGEFSAGKGLHTNGIESFWAILKRAVIGSYHHVSTKYLQNYVNECCFRQNNRGDNAFDKLLLQSVLTA